MSNLFNPDFLDFLQALNKCEVDYILVGGYAVILHGYERVTADIDIWVRCTHENYNKLAKAFQTFGMSLFDMTLDNFLDFNSWDVFRFGRKPVAIDIMTKVKGLDFEEAFERSEIKLIDGISVRLIHYNHLVEAKKQAGRNKDLDDLENLKD
jgi:predicted nucleotidyltransferase